MSPTAGNVRATGRTGDRGITAPADDPASRSAGEPSSSGDPADRPGRGDPAGFAGWTVVVRSVSPAPLPAWGTRRARSDGRESPRPSASRVGASPVSTVEAVAFRLAPGAGTFRAPARDPVASRPSTSETGPRRTSVAATSPTLEPGSSRVPASAAVACRSTGGADDLRASVLAGVPSRSASGAGDPRPPVSAAATFRDPLSAAVAFAARVLAAPAFRSPASTAVAFRTAALCSPASTDTAFRSSAAVALRSPAFEVEPFPALTSTAATFRSATR